MSKANGLFLSVAVAGLLAGPALAEPPVSTGRYTYAGHGSVNTHWIETQNGVIVIDVQRDTAHAAEALRAVRALGKPVLAILVTHGHPDHYTGLEQFLAEWPNAHVHASPETIRVIETDHYGYHQVVRDLAPKAAPERFVVPDRAIEADATLTIDGVEVVTREMGPSEATGATVYFLPETGDVYTGDLVLNKMHGFFLEGRSAEILSSIEALRVLFPAATTAHPGHGDPGPFAELVDRGAQYTRVARRLVAEAIADGTAGDEARTNVEAALKARFAGYGVPGGQPDMIALSVEGLFAELGRLPIVEGIDR